MLQRLSWLTLLTGLVAATASLPGSAVAADACNEEWKPVCATANGFQHTFTNACWAKMMKAKIDHKGECTWK